MRIKLKVGDKFIRLPENVHINYRWGIAQIYYIDDNNVGIEYIRNCTRCLYEIEDFKFYFRPDTKL